MRRASALIAAGSLVVVAAAACRSADEEQASSLCAEARAIEERDGRAALELRRKVWEEMPTAGTPSSRACGREVRERMGSVRVLVVTDETGAPEAVDGCAWAADAIEVFRASINPPFRKTWAERLAERCLDVVGRAWTREPDSEPLRELNARLRKIAAEAKD